MTLQTRRADGYGGFAGVTSAAVDAAIATAMATRWQLIDSDKRVKTDGDVVVASNSNTFAEASSALRFVLTGAVAGDEVRYWIAGWAVGSAGADMSINAATLDVGTHAIINQFVAGTRSGVLGYIDSTTSKPIGASISYTLQSGDITAGSVEVSLIASTGATLTIQADTTYSLQVGAELWRPAV